MKQNLGKYLSALFMALTLASFVGCASTAKDRGTAEVTEDAVITTKVKAAFATDPLVKATEVNVTTYRGVVQLSGFVSSQAAANKAVEIAHGVSGVKSVKNDVVVK